MCACLRSGAAPDDHGPTPAPNASSISSYFSYDCYTILPQGCLPLVVPLFFAPGVAPHVLPATRTGGCFYITLLHAGVSYLPVFLLLNNPRLSLCTTAPPARVCYFSRAHEKGPRSLVCTAPHGSTTTVCFHLENVHTASREPEQGSEDGRESLRGLGGAARNIRALPRSSKCGIVQGTARGSPSTPD